MGKLDQEYIKAAAVIGMQIRSCHRYSYKSGEWGTIIDAQKWSDRVVWDILWPDGLRDQWTTDDPDAGYEIQDVNWIYKTADDAILALTEITAAVKEDEAPGIRAPRELRNRITNILRGLTSVMEDGLNDIEKNINTKLEDNA